MKEIMEVYNFQSTKFLHGFYITHKEGTGVYAFFTQSTSLGR